MKALLTTKHTHKRALVLATSLTSAVLLCVGCAHEHRRPRPRLSYQLPAKTNLIAQIGSEEIPEDALINQDRLAFYDLEHKQFDLRKTAFQQLLMKKLVGAEAAAHNVDLDSYIRDYVWRDDTNVTQSDISKFNQEKHIPEAQLTDQIRERITLYLRDRKKERKLDDYVAMLTQRTAVTVYFKRPRISLPLDLPANTVSFGNPTAPVTLIEFIDLEDTFTSRTVPIMDQIKKEYGSRIRIAFVHFPMPHHKSAHAAAELSLAAAEQSKDAFWHFRASVLTNNEHLTMADLAKYAQAAGVDAEQCITSGKYASQVDEQARIRESIGIRSTPSFLINGELINGAPPFETFAEAIDAALEEAKNP